MQRFIDELRRRPKAVRAQAAFVIATSVTGLMFAGWLYGMSDRLTVESNDPMLAELQRQSETAERERPVPKSSVGSMFERLQRGAAALMFNQPSEDTTEAPDKSIDIDALLRQPPAARPAVQEQIVVPAGDDSTSTEGSVILIGTTTRMGTENNE